MLRVRSVALVLALASPPAAAHFLWAVGEPSGSLRVSFGEGPADETSSDLLGRLSGVRAWSPDGAPIALTTGAASLEGARPKGAMAVACSKTWGVVDRSGDGSGAFFLEYYAKAAATLEDAAIDTKLPLEVFARREGASIVALVRRGETRVSGVSLHVTLPSGQIVERVTDEKGEARFESATTGLHGLRARWIESRTGKVDEKSFGEVRHYSSLTFDVPAKASQPAGANGATQSGAVNRAADPEAYALLKGAHDSRQVMPEGFTGFECDLSLQEGDQQWSGHLVYRRRGEVEVRIDGVDSSMLDWTRRQILNAIGHRRGGSFAEGDGRYPLTLAADDHNPFGRLIQVNDDTLSSYRVRDNKVKEVTRTMDGSRFTISVIETMEADAGKYIANHFVVSYRDAETNALQKMEGYRDSYLHIDEVWLPSSRTVVTIEANPSPSIRTIRFKKHTQLRVVEASAEVSKD